MRRRILLLVVGMTALVVLAFAVPLAILIHNDAYNEGLDGLRKETGDIALFLREENSTKTPAQIRTKLAGLDSARMASVQLPSGDTVGRTPPGGLNDAPAAPGSYGGPSLDRGPRVDRARRGGAADIRVDAFRDGQLAQLRVPAYRAGLSLRTPGRADPVVGYTVRVYADDNTLRAGQTSPLLLLGGGAILLLVLGVVAGEVLTRRIVRPLVLTATTAQQLSTGDTAARAPTSGPAEVAAVGHALNRLADRIDQLIAEERETTADLSHRLRTPMTALRLDAEALRDPAEAERIGAHVITLERMLTAIIHAARRPQREGRMPSVDAVAVVRDRVGFWSALTEDQGRTATVTLPPGPLPVRAASEDLAAAIDALLENVIAHTPEGTPFSVRLSATEEGVRVQIADDGPGLPPDAPVRGRSDRGSSGLGLDIARRCAAASGGSMTLGQSPSGGAMVTLDLHTA
ncbi:MAG: HAMP domain-containing sensor histidine kinase [Jatrophihabitans sp.]